MPRPAFNAAGLPESIRELAIAKAARSWCYVTPDGRTFYFGEERAKAVQAKRGGEVWPPETSKED